MDEGERKGKEEKGEGEGRERRRKRKEEGEITLSIKKKSAVKSCLLTPAWGEWPYSYLLVRQDLYVAGADGPELISGNRVVFQGVEVLKLLDDRVVVRSYCLLHSCQDVSVGCFFGGFWGRGLGHVLCPLLSSLQRTE